MNGKKQNKSGQKILMSYLLRYLTFGMKKKMRNQGSEKLIHIGFVILRAERTYHT